MVICVVSQFLVDRNNLVSFSQNDQTLQAGFKSVDKENCVIYNGICCGDNNF